MKIYLASFYSADLKKSADRFREQALKMGIYNSIKIFTFNDLNCLLVLKIDSYV